MTADTPSHLVNEEETLDMLQKKYEELSFEEMSKRMAESNRQISQMLSASSSSSSSSSTTTSYTTKQEEEEEEEEEDKDIKWNKMFHRSANSGDLIKMQELLDGHQQKIDINAKDGDGTTPLIYAACFGKLDVAQFLLEHGAQVDIQDSFGWSALMWATNNHHENLVQLLLNHGASSTTKSTKGRTVFDFVNVQTEKNQKLIDLLSSTTTTTTTTTTTITSNPRDSFSSTTSSLFFKTTCSTTTISSNNSNSSDYYYHLDMEQERTKLFKSTMVAADFNDDVKERKEQEEEEEEEESTANEFYWDKCLPDQMFVFNSNDLDYILDTIITNLELPSLQQQDICVPANIIFLSARFAHYFSSHELLFQVLEGALDRISKLIKMNHRDVHVLSFWITNTTRLLYYLKRDVGLVVVTAEQQVNTSELVSEIYNLIVLDTEKRITNLLESAMLEHEEITGLDQVDFKDEWRFFFNKSITTKTSNNVTPQSITNLLSTTLFVLQSYHVHPIIMVQVLAQFFHYISSELFNRILTNKKFLCRSKAIQIRMNFSHLQDWIVVNKLPDHLINYLTPTIQLLQLLTCLTTLQDLMDFINTTKSFDLLNAPQIKRCVVSYRYEVTEAHLPEEIEKYAMQCAEDTIRNKKRLLVVRHTDGGGRLSTSTIRSKLSQEEQLRYSHEQEEDDEKEYQNDDIKETKDAKFMLPFSVPTTTQMMSFSHQNWHHSNKSNITNSESMSPILPSEEWMYKLDNPSSSVVDPVVSSDL